MAEATENLNSENETIEEIEKTHTEVQATDDVEKLKENNKRVFERAKKAEADKKELKAKLEAFEKAAPAAAASSNSQNSPEDVVLELVGKVPAELKEEMSAMAKYAREHKIPVDDVISLWSSKKGLTVPKSEIDKFNQANEAARNSGTGGNASSAARNDNSEVKSLSDKDLEAKVRDLASQGQL